MSFSWTRVRAISVKELRDYRRNRFVVGTMTVLPLLFIILPLIQLFDAYAHVDSTNLNRHVGLSMLYMLVIPAFLPSTLSAYSVVGEREQGTLEPALDHGRIRREEFLVGKAVAALVPDARPRLLGIWHLPRRCVPVCSSGDRLGDLLRHARAASILLFGTALLAGCGIRGRDRRLCPFH